MELKYPEAQARKFPEKEAVAGWKPVSKESNAA